MLPLSPSGPWETNAGLCEQKLRKTFSLAISSPSWSLVTVFALARNAQLKNASADFMLNTSLAAILVRQPGVVNGR